MDTRKKILRRIYLVYLAVVLVAFAIFYKVIHIQFIEGEKWRQKAQALTTETVIVKAPRGNILAADGNYFAISVPTYDLFMDTKAGGITEDVWKENIDSLAIGLAYITKTKSSSEYKSLLSKGRQKNARYLPVVKNLSYAQMKQIRQLPIYKMGKFKGGAIFEERSKRVKPYGILAARTIGKETDNSRGLGLEESFDSYLRGEEGERLVEKLSGGVLRPVDLANSIDPKSGLDIVTTIDPRWQEVAESELEYRLRMNDASHGCVVLMEVKTGDIKAIANLKKNDDGNYYESYNYAVGEAVDPGSTFKLASAIALLEDKFVRPTDSIKTGNGQMRFYDHILKDSKEGGHGTITFHRAFEVSSNVAFAKLVNDRYKSNPQAFIDYLERFHLNRKLNIEIPGEAQPRIKNRKDEDWSGLTLPMMAIGYESLVTPLQVLTLYNAVANGGKMMKPRIVSEVREHGRLVEKFEPQVLEERICSPSTIEMVKKMLEGVVANGSAQNLNKSLFKIAGKTGTAQISNNNLGYRSANRMSYRASFAGYFPADNPQYSIIVVVNSPSNGVFYGNVVAGPIFKAVADKVYASAHKINQVAYEDETKKMVGRAPVSKDGNAQDLITVLNKLNVSIEGTESASKWTRAFSREGFVKLSNINYRDDLVPDVVGMGARDAVYILEKRGLKVKTIGRGAVKYQSVAPGTNIRLAGQILLELQ